MRRIVIAGTVALALFLATLVLSVILLPSLRRYIEVKDNTLVVTGNAMSPTLKDGQLVTYHRDDAPKRVDIVVYQYPPDPALKAVGRVIGMPGDRVAVRDGAVITSGIKLEEPYLTAPLAYDLAELQLTGDQLYILGDNRNDSSDSHVWGPVPTKNVVGVVDVGSK